MHKYARCNTTNCYTEYARACFVLYVLDNSGPAWKVVIIPDAVLPVVKYMWPSMGKGGFWQIWTKLRLLFLCTHQTFLLQSKCISVAISINQKSINVCAYIFILCVVLGCSIIGLSFVQPCYVKTNFPFVWLTGMGGMVETFHSTPIAGMWLISAPRRLSWSLFTTRSSAELHAKLRTILLRDKKGDFTT